MARVSNPNTSVAPPTSVCTGLGHTMDSKVQIKTNTTVALKTTKAMKLYTPRFHFGNRSK